MSHAEYYSGMTFLRLKAGFFFFFPWCVAPSFENFPVLSLLSHKLSEHRDIGIIVLLLLKLGGLECEV